MGDRHRPTMIAAVAVAMVFGSAGVLKARSPHATGEAFGRLGLRRPGMLAVAVPVVELAIAVVLIMWTRWGGWAAIVVLSAFTAVLLDVMRRGESVDCSCFGATTGRPVGPVDLVRNALLMVASVVAVVRDDTGPPSAGEVIRGAAIVGIGYGALRGLRRLDRTRASGRPPR